MIASARLLETVTHTAPLGLRFLDEVTGTVVSGGLTVLHPRAGSEVPARASATRAASSRCAGCRACARSSAATAARRSGRARRRAAASGSRCATRSAASTTSPSTRPRRRAASSPSRAARRRAARRACRSSRRRRGPRRPPAPSSARSCATPTAAAPPPGARLEVETAGGRARGVADARGAVAVFLPYPPLPTTVASPPAQSRPSLLEQTWPLSIEAFYGGPLDGLDLCAVLDQPRAAIAQASPPAQTVSQTLRYGRELVLPGPLYLSRPA